MLEGLLKGDVREVLLGEVKIDEESRRIGLEVEDLYNKLQKRETPFAVLNDVKIEVLVLVLDDILKNYLGVRFNPFKTSISKTIGKKLDSERSKQLKSEISDAFNKRAGVRV